MPGPVSPTVPEPAHEATVITTARKSLRSVRSHADIHTRTGLAVIAAGAIVYAAGSTLMARPYLTRPALLFAAVPVAAVAGMLALGVLVLVVAILLAAVANNIDIPLDLGGGDGGAGRPARRRRRG